MKLYLLSLKKIFFYLNNKKAAQLYFDAQSEQLALNLHANENRNFSQSEQISPAIDDRYLNNQPNFRYSESGINDQLLRNESKK